MDNFKNSNIFNMLVGGQYPEPVQGDPPQGPYEPQGPLGETPGETPKESDPLLLPELTDKYGYGAKWAEKGRVRGQKRGEWFGRRRETLEGVKEKIVAKKALIMTIIYAIVALTLVVLTGILFAQGTEKKEILWSLWTVNLMFVIMNGMFTYMDMIGPFRLFIGAVLFSLYTYTLTLAESKYFTCASGAIYKVYIASHALNVSLFLITILNVFI